MGSSCKQIVTVTKRIDRFTWNFACKSRKGDFKSYFIRKPLFALNNALFSHVSMMGQPWDIQRGGVNIILTLHQSRNNSWTTALIFMKFGMVTLLWSGWRLMKRKTFAIEFDYVFYILEIRDFIFKEKLKKITTMSKVVFYMILAILICSDWLQSLGTCSCNLNN